MAEEKKDFKAVVVKITGGAKEHTDTLSRSMLYSGVNIFGQLSELYLQSKDEFNAVALQQRGGSSSMGGGNATSQDDGAGSGSTGMMSLNADVLQIFKRLQKRDAVTKVKAFQELETYLNGVEQGSDELSNLLTFFLYHFCRILMDESDKKVRESAHQAFAAFIRKGKRKLGPHLKKIFPLWLCSFADPSMEVATLAKQNFDNAFPEARQGAVFKLVYKNFLHFANEQLRQSEEAQTSGSQDEKTASNEAFDRITSQVLQALSHSFRFIESWTQEEQDQFKTKLLDVLDLGGDADEQVADDVAGGEETKDTPENVVTEEIKIDTTGGVSQEANTDTATTEESKVVAQAGKKRGRGRRGLAGAQGAVAKRAKVVKKQNYMWAFLSESYRGRVRAACLQFVSVFICKMPEEVIRSQLSQFAPLVFNLIGEKNSLLQSTLWKQAIFSIGKNFPESWSYINIKKDFLPKLSRCLKEAGFGSPVAVYENFVKYVSICPLYQLTNVATPNEGKLNKASFKERCNLLREAMQALYAGLQTDESVAFHVEHVASYFETLTFVMLKRVQPMLADASLKDEEKEFAINEISKIIQLPLTDFVTFYGKYKSASQNARNIRATIPKRFSQMLFDLASRNLDKTLFSRLCEIFLGCLDHAARNSGRIFSYVLKHLKNFKPEYMSIVVQSGLAPLIASMGQELTKEIPDANKQTVEAIVKKCTLLRRLLYTLNKNVAASQLLTENAGPVKLMSITSGELLLKLQIKEKLAFKMLSAEDLKHFMAIKTSLCESTILMMNLGWTEAEPEMIKILTQGIFVEKLASAVLQKGTDQLEEIVFMPEVGIPEKVQFTLYFDAVRENEEIHEAMFEAMSEKMLLKDQIKHYTPMISSCIDKQILGKPSPLSEDDVEILKSFVIMVLQGDEMAGTTLDVLVGYFTAAKGLLKQQGDEQNEELRELILEQLLNRKVKSLSEQPRYNKMWEIFTEAVKGKPAYVEQCVEKLCSATSQLIQSDSNNLEGVSSFQHLTNLIYRFVHLQADKVGVLTRIFLTKENFDNLDYNPLPLKMFRDLFLDGSINFDISQLVQEKNADDGSFKYAWLLAAMLNFKYLVSLTNFLELKNQLIIYVESDVIPALIVGDKQFIVTLCEAINEKALDGSEAASGLAANSYQLTLEYFIAKMVDPGEDFAEDMKPVLRIEDFSDIFTKVSKQTALSLIATNFGGEHNTRAIDILEKLVSQISYFILDEPVLLQLYDKLKANLQGALESRTDLATLPLCPQQICLYMSMAKFLERTDSHETTTLFQINLVNFLLESQDSADDQFKSKLQQLAIQISGMLFSPETKQLIKEKMNTVDLMNTIIEMLMQISEQVDQPVGANNAIDCRTLMQLCGVIKKTLGWTAELTETIVSVFVQAVKDRAMWFDRRIQEQATNMAGGLQQLEVEMLKEMGETLLVCVSHITVEVLKAHVEDNLYYILGCQVEALQKASYVLLKFIYENFIPPVDIKFSAEEEVKQLMTDFNDESQDAEEFKGDEGHLRGKADLAFRNVSRNLVEMIDNAPNVVTQDNEGIADSGTQFMASNEVLQKLVLGESQEGCMNNKIYGYLLAWNAMLKKIEEGRIKSQLMTETQYQAVLASLTDYLEANSPIYEMLLVSLVPYLPIVTKKVSAQENYGRELSQFQPEYSELADERASRLMALHTLVNFMKSFPSLARKFYDTCDRQLLAVTKPYIKQIVSPAIMENEIKKIELAQVELGAQNQLSVVLYKSTKEIVATYDKNNEISVQIKLKIPAEYPLKSVQVDFTEQIKLKAGQVRKWSLSIRNLIQSRNGDLISAILLWKQNIDQEMDGVEECHICYCVLHATDRSLPNLPCKNCSNKFHVGCIRKWFQTSNKSNCPLCQTFFWQ